MKTALVLGAGGARGLAHLGVIKVLEREGFKPDLIVGSSAGAIIGAMYAQNPHLEAVENRMRKFLASDLYNEMGIEILEKHKDNDDEDFLRQVARNIMKRVMLNMVASRQSILKDRRMDDVIDFLLDGGNIRETKIPFACIATDLVSGRPVIFNEGDLRTAVRASSSIPGYLPPVEYQSKILVDGAVVCNLPIGVARNLGAETVISVEVKQELKPQQDFKNVIDIILRAANVTSQALNEKMSHDSDIQIMPHVEDFMWYDFDKMDTLMRAGEEAAYTKLREIKNIISKPELHFWQRLSKLVKISEN